MVATVALSKKRSRSPDDVLILNGTVHNRDSGHAHMALARDTEAADA